MQNMQLDTVDVGARVFVPILTKIMRKALTKNWFAPEETNYEEFVGLVKIVEEWDSNVAPGSIGATIFNIWLKRIGSQFLRSTNLKDSIRVSVFNSEKGDHLLYIKLNAILENFETVKDYAWCHNEINSVKERPCIDVIGRSLEDVTKYLK